MITCVYVGGDCSQIDDREFDSVGQRASFSEQTFRDAILGGAAFIREEDFSKLGFTEEEISVYGPFGTRVDVPQSFGEKLATAQQIFRDTYARMHSEASKVLAEALDRELGFAV